MRRSVEGMLTLRRRTVTHAWLERDEIRLGRDDGPFFFSCPERNAARVLRAGAHLTLHGVVFASLCPGRAVHRPWHVETRVNALMRRCAASGTQDRYYFALAADRFNSNPSRSSVA